MTITAVRSGLGRRAYVVAVVAALLGGLSGIALGSWLSWRTVDAKAPSRAVTAGIAPTVLPGPVVGRVDYYGRSTFWNPYSEGTLHGGTGVRVGRAGVAGTMPPQTGFEQVAADVRQRMVAGGWQDVRTTVHRYGPSMSPAADAEVTGTRDGYLAAVQINPGDELNPASVELSLMWAEPSGHRLATLAGGLAGVLFGALLGLGTAWRMRSAGAGRRRAYGWLCLATLLLLAPACLGNIPTETGSWLSATHRNGTGPSVFWGGFVIYGAEPLAILAVLPILAVLVLCLWPRRAR